MAETMEMMEILHQNKIEVRKFNHIRTRKNKKEQLESYAVISLSSSLFFFGAMYLIAIIENLPF